MPNKLLGICCKFTSRPHGPISATLLNLCSMGGAYATALRPITLLIEKLILFGEGRVGDAFWCNDVCTNFFGGKCPALCKVKGFVKI